MIAIPNPPLDSSKVNYCSTKRERNNNIRAISTSTNSIYELDNKKPKVNPSDTIQDIHILFDPKNGVKEIRINTQKIQFSAIVEVTKPIQGFDTFYLKESMRSFLRKNDLEYPIPDYITIEDVKPESCNDFSFFLMAIISQYKRSISRKLCSDSSLRIQYHSNKNMAAVRGFAINGKECERFHGISSTENTRNIGDYKKSGYCECITERDRKMGEFKEDMMTGFGRSELYLKEPCTLVGEWQRNYLHGLGASLFSSGFVNAGMYLQGEKNGFQVYSFTDGESYVGGVRKQKKNGLGISKVKNMSEGNYVDDHLKGCVSIATSDCLNYIGHFQNGRPEGRGYMVRCNDNTIYEGGLREGVFHGMGQLILIDKYSVSMEKGYFVNGHRKIENTSCDQSF